MTPRSRRPVLLISGTNLSKLPSTVQKETIVKMDGVTEETVEEINVIIDNCEVVNDSAGISEFKEVNDSLTSTFKEYLSSRGNLTDGPTDLSFSSRTDDYNSADIKDLSASKLSSSLLYCLDGNLPSEGAEEKELVLKPKQFDKDGKPTVFETSF